MQRLKRIVDTLLPGENAVQTGADELLQVWKQTCDSGSGCEPVIDRDARRVVGWLHSSLGVLLARLAVYARDGDSDAVLAGSSSRHAHFPSSVEHL